MNTVPDPYKMVFEQGADALLTEGEERFWDYLVSQRQSMSKLDLDDVALWEAAKDNPKSDAQPDEMWEKLQRRLPENARTRKRS